MKKTSKIHAFTLMEFSIAMLISTIIVGILLFSLFYLNKGNGTYMKQLFQYETGFDLVARIQIDMFRSNRAAYDNDILKLEYTSMKPVAYQFVDNCIIRSMAQTVDTFSVGAYTIDPNYHSTDQKILESMVLGIKAVTKETVEFTFECNKSTDTYISSNNGD